MNTRPVFHGSDIEKICEYYHLQKEDITNFGANVNPLGLSESVKETLSSRLDVLSSYPDREYTSLREVLSVYCRIPCGLHPPRERFQRADLSPDRRPDAEANSHPRADLF